MNEKKFEEAVQATITELRSMTRSELRAEIEKRENSDFARIFSEDNDDDYPIQVNQRDLNTYLFEEKLEKLFSKVVERQLKKFLPVVVEEVLSKVEQRA